ncbi:deoxyribose-phosphate aldolase [Knoellia subterranea]|uniref:Deoxyribose-phosphate aldolase n=1 Tax=Knoellia subterranea KCTC 19937 TaxID=1385521 RepID=A0A0A0JFQ4_9MICO|nr:deoxyribose-phosphate aldolase [Knoellia subterranea]KGN35569.1 deoxyribose-phosphate aldolase [Knoellia subterranea KCTC 19937]
MSTTTETPSRTAIDATARARDLLGVSRLTNQALTTWLHGLPGVDQVGCEARAAGLGTRSIKTTSKQWAIDLAISMIDLTTLEGADTHGRVRGLAAKALVPDPSDLSTPRPAAVCVYGDMVATAKQALGDSDVKVAAVATAFPSGRASMAIKLADTKDAVKAGADEIDMVIDRGAFLSGDYLTVFNQIAEVTKACDRGDGTRARLKVIMETGELVTYDNVRRASWLSMLAGGDFIKTSTGKIQPAATLPVTLIMLEAVRDWRDLTGEMVGVKPAGGIKTSKDAIKFLVTVSEIAGEDWLTNQWFRFGASSLLNDLLLQRQRMTTGAYSGANYIADDSPSTAY